MENKEVSQQFRLAYDEQQLDLMRLPGAFGPERFPNDPNHPSPFGDGFYSIVSTIHGGKVIDAESSHKSGSNAVIWEYATLNSQRWLFSFDKERKSYQITSGINPNMVLTWSSKDNSVILEINKVTDLHQYWVIQRNNTGDCTIVNANDKYGALTLDGKGETTNGTPIKILTKNKENTFRQSWNIRPIIYQFFRNNVPYHIRSQVDSNILIDASLDNNKIYAINFNGGNNQKWYFEFNTNLQAYTIRSFYNPTRVLTKQYNTESVYFDIESSDNMLQHWRVQQTSQGFVIRNLSDPFYTLSLNSNSAVNDTPILSKKYDYNLSQKWSIEEGFYQMLANGDYIIRSATNEDMIISKAGRALIAKSQPNIRGKNQRWNFKYSFEWDAYMITNVDDRNVCLSMFSDESSIDIVIISSSNNNSSSFWRLQLSESGHFSLRNLKFPTLAITLSDGNLKGKGFHDNTNQRWNIERTDQGIIQDGTYQINTSIDFRRCIDIHHGNEYTIIWEYYGQSTALWYFKFNKDMGAYTIASHVNQDKCLRYISRNYRATIDVLDDDNYRFYWYVEYNLEKGGYVIRNMQDPVYILDLAHSNTSNGTEILTFRASLDKNQIWNIVSSARQKTVDRVNWVSRRDKDIEITDLPYIIVSGKYLDKSYGKEIDLIFYEQYDGNRRLNMTNYEIIASQSGIIGTKNTASNTFATRGHVILDLYNTGETGIMIKSKNNNYKPWYSTFLVSPLWSVDFRRGINDIIEVLNNEPLRIPSDYKDSVGLRSLTFQLHIKNGYLDTNNCIIDYTDSSVLGDNISGPEFRANGDILVNILRYGRTTLILRDAKNKQIYWTKDIYIDPPNHGTHLHESIKSFGTDGFTISRFEDESVSNLSMPRGNITSLQKRSTSNISSVTLHPKGSITLYEDTNFKGRSITLNNDANEEQHHVLSDPRYNFDNITSSYKVSFIPTLNNIRGSIKTSVSSNESILVPNANVTLYSQNDVVQNVVSDDQGNFTLDNVSIGQRIVVEESQYFTGSIVTDANMVNKGNIVINLIRRPALLSGCITDSMSGDTPIAGARVQIINNGRSVASAVTDAVGNYVITYFWGSGNVLSVNHENFAIYTQPVTTIAGNENIVNVSLSPINATDFGGQVSRILTLLDQNFVINMSPANINNIHLLTYSSVQQQYWQMVLDAGTNSYTIFNTHANSMHRFLTQTGESTIGFSNTLTNMSRWRIISVKDGIFKIINVHTGNCIQIQSNQATNEAIIQMSPYNNTVNQHWLFENISLPRSNTREFSRQNIRLVTELNQASSLNIPSNNHEIINLWTYNNGVGQHWQFNLDVVTNSYTIFNTHNNVYLSHGGGNILSYSKNATIANFI